MIWIKKFWLDTLLYQRDLFPIEYIKEDKLLNALEKSWDNVLQAIIFDQLICGASELDWYCEQVKILFAAVPWMIHNNKLYRIARALKGIGYAAGRHSSFPYNIMDEKITK